MSEASNGIRAEGLNGFVEFDGRVVVVRHRGWRTTGAGGRSEVRVPVSMITEIRWKPPTVLDPRGVMQFVTAGGGARRYGRVFRSGGALRDDSAIVFGSRHRRRMEEFRSVVEQAMVGRGS